MWSAGLKVMNFQLRTEPIRLFNITNFPSIVKDELAVLQQRAAAQKTAETRIHMALCYAVGFFLLLFCSYSEIILFTNSIFFLSKGSD